MADAVPARYRAMVLLATFASLRFGEVTALERADLDLEVGTVRVRRAFVEVRGKGLVVGPPKSRAGLRVVSIPPSVVEALRTHPAEHAGPGALVFTVPNGAPVGRGNFNKLVGWREKVEQLGLKGVRFHDLRHTGEHARGGERREHARPHVSDGARLDAGGARLPARHGDGGHPDRGRPGGGAQPR